MANEEHLENTVGAFRVGLALNPSGDDRVDTIKRLSAELINQMIDFAAARAKEQSTTGNREAGIAIQGFEEACMWAVKAITKPEFPV
jgi:hypothetical protein